MRTIKILCLVIPALFILCVVLTILLSGPGKAEKGSECPVGMLPAEARDILYYQRPPLSPNSYAEFSASEEVYRAWVEKWRERNKEMDAPRKESPTRTYRYNQVESRMEAVEITRGLRADWTYEDQGIHLVYDLDEGKAYFWMHTR